MHTPLSVRRPRLIIALAVLGMALAGLFGADDQDSRVPGGFDDPGSESAAAAEILTEEFDAGAPDLVLLVTAADGSVDDPAVAGPAT
ncbi:MAG TPA: hypothetical protein VMM13_14455, partial [Euzebya sp.]|nr:hypothetical protein [Euzebya sp.]